MVDQSRAQAVKAAIAERLRHIMKNHPNGPLTVDDVADKCGVSARRLFQMTQSGAATNVTVETLVKVADGLGIERVAYFLDRHVFDQVNVELEALKTARRNQVRAVELRISSGETPARELHSAVSDLLAEIVTLGEAARLKMREVPTSTDDPIP